jgi:hypothetical protein
MTLNVTNLFTIEQFNTYRVDEFELALWRPNVQSDHDNRFVAGVAGDILNIDRRFYYGKNLQGGFTQYSILKLRVFWSISYWRQSLFKSKC